MVMEDGVFMSKNEQFEFRVLDDYRNRRITRQEAAVLLGVNWRTVIRRVKKIRRLGFAGIKHGNSKKTPANKSDENKKQAMLKLAKKLYYDFNMSHCLEMLLTNQNLRRRARCDRAGNSS